MNSLLKSVKSMTNRKNFLVKESLRKQLNTIIMELEGIEGIKEGEISNTEETMALCSILEAIFLHGLKDSLLNRVTEALSGPDFDAMPQPSFWGPLLIISHREMIDQIQNLSQITSEVGYSRAWIRLALNEGLLSSYLMSIQRDDSVLSPYYNRTAFIRDQDDIEVTRRLIDSLDNITFKLAFNTSLLNFWNSTPLMMAAIWSPPMKSCPVFSAVDIAKTISSEISDNFNGDDVETASSIGSMGSFSSQSVLTNMPIFNEDDALKMILSGDEERERNTSTPIDFKQTVNHQQKVEESHKESKQLNLLVNPIEKIESAVQVDDNNLPITQQDISDKRKDEDDVSESIVETSGIAGGNSLLGKLGWSTSIEENENAMTSSVISKGSDVSHTPGDIPTYDALIKSYGAYSASPNLQDFIDKFAENEVTAPTERVAPSVKTNENNFDKLIGHLPREKGLDTQNYSCFDCDHPIGMTFAKAHVCSLTGNYYCFECMSTEEFAIPSRIIQNWDLRHYPVSRKAANYLNNCSILLNLKQLNPKIYSAVDSMARLHTLRVQLNFLRAYLYTCREPIIESLQEKVSSKEYLYEHVHQYSISDLLDITSGNLAQYLQKIVDFARNHVLTCWLCSQKGFICEICNNPKVIYPFDVATTYRCNDCNAVFHADCLNSRKPCPKCERKRKRIHESVIA